MTLTFLVRSVQVIAIVGVAAVTASAQSIPLSSASVDPRWAPWLGCWQIVDETEQDAESLDDVLLSLSRARASAGARVCVTPADGGVTMTTLVDDQPVLIETVVATSDKQRFALDPSGRRIRANQGHSIAIDLGLEPREPPPTLFHGTAETFLPAIRAQGLKPGRRQHVHLSPDAATATTVGQRHGRPVVLRVAAGRMRSAGFEFYLSANGVWLTAAVPAEFIEFPQDDCRIGGAVRERAIPLLQSGHGAWQRARWPLREGLEITNPAPSGVTQ